MPYADQGSKSEVARLKVMGGFELMRSGHAVGVPLSVQKLVAFLALHDRVLGRSYVAGRLWPEGSQSQCYASLRSALWRLRRNDVEVVRVTPSDISLAENVAVDARQVVDRVKRLTDMSVPCDPSDLDPAPLCGELLPGWTHDDWLTIERERIRQMCLHGLEALCDRLRELGRYGQAVEAGLAAVHGEPLRESAHRALIRVHLAEGNHSEALRQYHWYRDYLHDELRLEPSPQLLRLVERLLVAA